MSDNTDLESRMVAAIRHYRAALELAEHLEREDASAQRAVTSTLLDLESAVGDKAAPHLKHSVCEIGHWKISRVPRATRHLEATVDTR